MLVTRIAGMTSEDSDTWRINRKPLIVAGYGISNVVKPLLAFASGWGFVLGLVLLASDARAQQPEADKSKTQPPAASGQNSPETPYTVNSSIEFGVRGIVIDGNADKYRSDLNYTPGFRIFDSSFMMKSK